MRQFSTGELQSYISATTFLMEEVDRRMGKAKSIVEEDLWAARKKQFKEARDVLYEELGRRILEATSIPWEEINP